MSLIFSLIEGRFATKEELIMKLDILFGFVIAVAVCKSSSAADNSYHTLELRTNADSNNEESSNNSPNTNEQWVSSDAKGPHTLELRTNGDSSSNAGVEAGNSDKDEESRIAGGSNAQPGQFPYQVHLNSKFSGGKGAGCGGSIIDKNWILTAGHCVVDGKTKQKASQVQVSAGGVNQDQQPIKVVSNQLFPHPQYRLVSPDGQSIQSIDNDIALIRVNTNLIQPPKSSAVKLPSANQKIEGQIVVASGYGLTEQGRPSGVLKAVEMKILTDQQCRQPIFKPKQMFCAGGVQGHGHGTCSGDSGGPIVLKGQNVIVGLTSFGSDCGGVGGYTKVSNYLDFIHQTMKSSG